MTMDPGTPKTEPSAAGRALTSALRTASWLAVVAAIAGAVAYALFEWRIRSETAALDALRLEVRQAQERLAQQSRLQEEFAQKVERVEKAASEARLLLNDGTGTTTLDARLKELDTLKLDLQKTREELESRFKTMERSIVDQVAKQGKETAQALSIEMRYKSLLIKAQGEVLLAQLHWKEGNRGLAKDELSIAATSLRQAMETAPEAVRPAIKQVFDLAESARSALILEQSSARDSLNLLWHRVSELLAAQ